MNTTPDGSTQPSPGAARPKHILAPVDFSRPCLHGLTAAIDLARRFRAELTLVHVVKHIPGGSQVGFEAGVLEQDWQRPARERLAEFTAIHVPHDLPVRQVVAEGKPFHEVVQLAAKLGCDLIVVATHGYTGLPHVLMGSNSERMVQYAPCPVLVVRGRPDPDTPPAAKPTAFEWILLPTDFSENSRKAFPLAAAMAQEFGAPLTLVYVLPSLPVPEALPGEIPCDYREQEILQEHAKAELELRRWRTEHFSPALNTSTMVLEGIPHQMLSAAAEAPGCGLIIIATHGQTGWQHALLGSTAEQVIRHAPCPVLAVR